MVEPTTLTSNNDLQIIGGTKSTAKTIS